jgi:nucleoid-associated protein YgaU
MKDPYKSLQELLQPGGLNQTLYPPNSRYHGIETATLETKEGRTVIYLKRRFCPPPEQFEMLQEHTVTQGDRMDNIAAQYLGDPEQYWRICDANGAMQPEELTDTIGRTIRITLPEGIQGPRND